MGFFSHASLRTGRNLMTHMWFISLSFCDDICSCCLIPHFATCLTTFCHFFETFKSINRYCGPALSYSGRFSDGAPWDSCSYSSFMQFTSFTQWRRSPPRFTWAWGLPDVIDAIFVCCRIPFQNESEWVASNSRLLFPNEPFELHFLEALVFILDFTCLSSSPSFFMRCLMNGVIGLVSALLPSTRSESASTEKLDLAVHQKYVPEECPNDPAGQHL